MNKLLAHKSYQFFTIVMLGWRVYLDHARGSLSQPGSQRLGYRAKPRSARCSLDCCYAGQATTQQTVSYPVSAGSNRVLVVAIALRLSALAPSPCRYLWRINLSYGMGDMGPQPTRGAANRNILLEGIPTGKLPGTPNLVFTVSGGTIRETASSRRSLPAWINPPAALSRLAKL